MIQMKKILYSISLLFTLLVMSSCENIETYADMEEKEQGAISGFIASQGITVIDENLFNAQGQTTDVEKNQFVRFSRNGVYMQIVRKGCGEKMEENKNVVLLCRTSEKNLLTGSEIYNNRPGIVTMSGVGSVDVATLIDKMNVTRNGTTITASFVDGLMYQFHGSTSVPAGWLVPLNYINVGYPEDAEDQVAKVRLIVPHSQGTADASSSVTPYYYELTFQRPLS